MRIPEKLYRKRNDVDYEVLNEFYQMWKQAYEHQETISKNLDETTTKVIQAQIKREIWEEAMMVYAGWSGTELHEYLMTQLDPFDERRGSGY